MIKLASAGCSIGMVTLLYTLYVIAYDDITSWNPPTRPKYFYPGTIFVQILLALQHSSSVTSVDLGAH